MPMVLFIYTPLLLYKDYGAGKNPPTTYSFGENDCFEYGKRLTRLIVENLKTG